MAIDSELDYTPLSTFSTMQFHNESVNILVSSLILTMILANLGSIISRAVSITGKDELCYKDWSRAFIFAHSDDPLKLISWLRGAYIFRNQSWRRLPNRVRLDRLVIPITARGILFIASLVSILVTFPSSTSMPGCVRADYALHMNKVQTNVRNDFEGLCKHIPLVSLGGHVASRASFCYTPMNQTNPLPANITDDLLEEDSNIIVAVVWNRRHATMEFGFINRNDFFGVAMFAEWSNPEGRSFRSDLSATIEPDTRLALSYQLWEMVGLRAVLMWIRYSFPILKYMLMPLTAIRNLMNGLPQGGQAYSSSALQHGLRVLNSSLDMRSEEK